MYTDYVGEIWWAIVVVAVVAIVIASNQVFRVIFWESIKHPRQKTKIEVRDSRVEVKNVA